MLNNIVIKLLRDSGKISLPAVGVLVKVDMEDETAYLFTPSSTKMDSRMVDIVMSEMDVSHDEAINLITCYVDFMKGVIAKNGKYHFKEIGDMMCDEQSVFYFTPIVVAKSDCVEYIEQEIKIEEEIKEAIIEEIAELQQEVIEPIIEPITDEIKEEIVLSEAVFVVEDIIEEKKEEGSTRINERTQTRRLGEIIEGGANKRFYDKVHSQVVSKAVEDIIKENDPIHTIVEHIEESVEMPKEAKDIEENSLSQPSQRSQPTHELSSETLKEMLGHNKRKGIYEIYDKGAYKDKMIAKPVLDRTEEIVKPQSVQSSSPAPAPKEQVYMQPQSKKKVDFVVVVSLAVIVAGLAVIAYFYYIQKELGL